VKSISIVLILIISLFSYSCSVDNEGVISDIRSTIYPDIELQQATYQVSRGDKNPLFVNGEIIEIYKDLNKTFVTNASFVQYNNNKEIMLKGSFGEAHINTLTNDIELQNSVSITIFPDELHIEGSSMSYNSDRNIVTGKDNEVITLSNKKGDILKGKGFKGDLEKTTFEFSELEKGVLNYE
jgi:LPS export ABC transporter protein LptC